VIRLGREGRWSTFASTASQGLLSGRESQDDLLLGLTVMPVAMDVSPRIVSEGFSDIGTPGKDAQSPDVEPLFVWRREDRWHRSQV
jgi:hypothetical protein